MAYRFTAAHTAVDNDDDALTVAVADAARHAKRYLMLQRAHKFDAQDRKLGMDRVWVEVEDEDRSCYGGIRSIVVREGTLIIVLDQSGEANLDIKGSIEVKLPESEATHKAVAAIAEIAEKDGIPFSTG